MAKRVGVQLSVGKRRGETRRGCSKSHRRRTWGRRQGRRQPRGQQHPGVPSQGVRDGAEGREAGTGEVPWPRSQKKGRGHQAALAALTLTASSDQRQPHVLSPCHVNSLAPFRCCVDAGHEALPPEGCPGAVNEAAECATTSRLPPAPRQALPRSSLFFPCCSQGKFLGPRGALRPAGLGGKGR